MRCDPVVPLSSRFVAKREDLLKIFLTAIGSYGMEKVMDPLHLFSTLQSFGQDFNARISTFRSASSFVLPYAMTPEISGISAIQRPSVSCSHSIFHIACPFVKAFSSCSLPSPRPPNPSRPGQDPDSGGHRWKLPDWSCARGPFRQWGGRFPRWSSMSPSTAASRESGGLPARPA